MARHGEGMRLPALSALVALLASSASPVAADLPPDTGLAERQGAALRAAVEDFVPLRDYHLEYLRTSDPGYWDVHSERRRDCHTLGTDATRLAAALELHRRGLAGGVAPAEAEPWARHILQAYIDLVGDADDPRRCRFYGGVGLPGITYAIEFVAFALHQYAREVWDDETRALLRRAVWETSQANWWSEYLTNMWVNVLAADLLAGEALGDAEILARGHRRLQETVDVTMRMGLLEANAPIYTSYHLNALVPLQVLEREPAASQVRILLDYVLLLQAHLYLPGGAIGAPQSRDYAGGDDDVVSALHKQIDLLVDDPTLDHDHWAGAALGAYSVPEVVRSIFLDKGEGYFFGAQTGAALPTEWVPDVNYPLGIDGEHVSPWEAVVLPGGDAMFGVAHGYRNNDLQVTNGVYVRRPDGGWAVLHHSQPGVNLSGTSSTPAHCACPGPRSECIDRWDSGGMRREMDADPDDFLRELWDFERLVHGRTLVQLWDPANARQPRICPDTRVHLPDFEALGGATVRRGRWWVSRLGDVYVAFRPIGAIGAEEDQGDFIYLRLDGPSGSIVELATAEEFESLEQYADDLAARHLDVSIAPLTAEIGARNADGTHTTIRLEHRPERRFVDGVERTPAELLDHDVMRSPWVSWHPETRQLRVARGCYEGVLYDWDDATVTAIAPPESCSPAAVADGGAPADAGPIPDAGGDAGDGSIIGVIPPDPDEAGGCACTAAGTSSGLPGALLLAGGLLGAVRARRRRPHRLRGAPRRPARRARGANGPAPPSPGSLS